MQVYVYEQLGRRCEYHCIWSYDLWSDVYIIIIVMQVLV